MIISASEPHAVEPIPLPDDAQRALTRELTDLASGEFLGYLAAGLAALLSQVALVTSTKVPDPPTWPFWILFVAATVSTFVFVSFAVARHDLSLVWLGDHWRGSLAEIRQPIASNPGRRVYRPPANWFTWCMLRAELALFSPGRFRPFRQLVVVGALTAIEVALWAVFLGGR